MGTQPVRCSARSSLLQPTAVNCILEEVREQRARGADLVSLMRGEPDFPTPPHIVEAAVRSLRAGRTAYPDNQGEPALREAIAAKLLAWNALRYDAHSEILVTSGATFGIYAALAALLNDGDEVLLPDPVYDAYQSPIRLAGGRASPVRARIDCSGDAARFVLDREALEAAWTPRCRVLLLNTPWNPVGAVFGRQELQELADFAERKNLVVISDEIYEAITYEPAGHVSPAAVADSLRQRCILVNSLSKTYAMTGWRVGYCAGPADLVRAMFLVLQQSSRGPATFVQDAATEALRGPQDCVAEMRTEYAGRRAQVLEGLAGVPGTRVLPPEGGFFAMVDIRELGLASVDIRELGLASVDIRELGLASVDIRELGLASVDIRELGLASNEVRRKLLGEHGVVVVHGAAYGAGGEGMLRVSFASGGENLARGLERLRAGLLALAGC